MAEVLETKQITGPAGIPLLGIIPKMQHDAPGFLLQTARKYGGMAMLDFGLRRMVLVSDPDYVRHILQANHHNYIRGRSLAVAREFLGNGLAMVDGDQWLQQRRMMQPAFSKAQLKRLHPIIIETVRDRLDTWQANVENGQPIDMAAEMTHITLTIIVLTMFSTDIRTELDALEDSFSAVQDYLIGTMNMPVQLPLWIPTSANRRFAQARKQLDTIIYDVIARRRAAGGNSSDLLTMLLQARDPETGEGMTDQQIRDEVLTIFFAGHETTATALAWAWHALTTHPDIYARLKAEIYTVVGNEPPSFDHLPDLTYTRQIFDETLRYYSPIWMYVREAVDDDIIDGYHIPAGTTLMLSPYATHHNPTLWHNPEEFDPERFHSDQVKSIPQFGYYPFGGGPHLCIGNNFAIMEAQVILAMMVQRYNLTLVPDHPIDVLPGVTLKPRHGLMVTLSPVS